MSIVFVGHSNRSSGIIRGQQVAERMEGATFIEPGNAKALNKVRDRVCLIVRQPEPQALSILKANGCKVGYDLLDRPVSDYHDATNRGQKDGDIDWKRYDNPLIDFYVVNNTHAKRRLAAAVGPKPIHIIPHHTVNFESRRNDLLERPARVAYVGIPNQFSKQDEVRKLCESHGAKLACVNPQTREECVEVMKLVDVGVIFYEQSEKVPYTLRYKPNTKLSNFQSFGIPTVAVPYASFDEFGGDAWERAKSFDDFESKLEALLTNGDRRRELAEAGHQHAKRFHIDNVVRDHYGALLFEHGA